MSDMAATMWRCRTDRSGCCVRRWRLPAVASAASVSWGAANMDEYRLIRSRITGESWTLHVGSMTCGGPLDHTDVAAASEAPAQLARHATDDDADDWMLDDAQVDVLASYIPDKALITAAVEASGLSARRFGERILARDERTVRRWAAGDMPIPDVARAWLEHWLALSDGVRSRIVGALG